MKATVNRTDDLWSWSAEAPLYGKFTYLGDQEKPIPSVFFQSVGAMGDYEVFVPHQSEDIRYSNDTVGNAGRFLIDKEEQAAILAKLGDITPGPPPPSPRWAFVLVQVTAPKPRGVEWLLDDALARRVVNGITEALSPENEQGRRLLSQMPLP